MHNLESFFFYVTKMCMESSAFRLSIRFVNLY